MGGGMDRVEQLVGAGAGTHGGIRPIRYHSSAEGLRASTGRRDTGAGSSGAAGAVVWAPRQLVGQLAQMDGRGSLTAAPAGWPEGKDRSPATASPPALVDFSWDYSVHLVGTALYI